MLTFLRLKNYIFIDELELELKKGLTILTGETGSGKSILIGAINLLLGEKIDKNIVKKNKDFCEISIVFDLEDKGHDFLLSLELNDFLDETNSFELIFSRRISKENKSKFYINDKLIAGSSMKNFLDKIIEIHGQNSNQNIFSQDEQLNILDRFANNSIEREEIEILYSNKTKIEKRLTEISEEKKKLSEKKDFLIFQLDELNKINLKENEDKILEEEYKNLANVDIINQHINSISSKTASISLNITNLVKDLEKLAKYKTEYQKFTGEVNSSLDMFSEIESQVLSFKHGIDSNNYKLDEVGHRLDKITKIKKKYNMEITDLIAYKNKIDQDLQNIDSDSNEEIELKEKLENNKTKLKNLADKLSEKRKIASLKLENLVNENLKELCMEKVVFKIFIEVIVDASNNFVFTKTGINKIKFLIQTNSGQNFDELQKIVSGGELSRIMLAIKSVLSGFDKIPVLIFDEIDTGIGGKTAFVVGKKLKNISKKHQVLCITHLPQVAVFGEHNKIVKKDIAGDETKVTVMDIADSEKIDEIARMLGGYEITDAVRKNAEELIESATKI
jgi:DNA repair protein RecN (Recombination protein N)